MKSALPRAMFGTVLTLFALGSMAQTGYAQSPRRVAVGIGGGATLPVSDLAEDTKSGWHGLAFLQYEPAAGMWGVRGEVAYHKLQLTDEALADVGAAPGDEISNAITHVGGTAVLRTSGQSGFSPYALAGLGLYRVTISSTAGAVTLSDSENGFGFNVGGGLRLGGNLFVEARFHQFSITTQSDDGVDVTSTYRMLPVSLGFRF